MNYLYLITEDDNDDLFFEACLEELTGLSFQLDNTRIRMRKGTGITETRRMLRRVLQELQRIGRQENIYLVVTIDNDRGVTHPHHITRSDLATVEKPKVCRFCELQQEFEATARYYAPHQPPDQLKDLCQVEMMQAAIHTKAEFYLECVINRLDPEVLAAQSPSFAEFKRQVEQW